MDLERSLNSRFKESRYIFFPFITTIIGQSHTILILSSTMQSTAQFYKSAFSAFLVLLATQTLLYKVTSQRYAPGEKVSSIMGSHHGAQLAPLSYTQFFAQGGCKLGQTNGPLLSCPLEFLTSATTAAVLGKCTESVKKIYNIYFHGIFHHIHKFQLKYPFSYKLHQLN